MLVSEFFSFVKHISEINKYAVYTNIGEKYHEIGKSKLH